MKLNLTFLLLLAFFVINLSILTHYSYSWDDLIHRELGKNTVDFLTKGTPFPKETANGQQVAAYGSLSTTIGYLSETFFSQNLNLLPKDAAFHLPILFFAVIGLFVLIEFTKRYIGKTESILAFIFLITMPRFISHLHQNIKDIPSASLFTLSIYTFTNAVYKPKIINWLFASVALGLAFATKINAIQIPVIIISWLVLMLVIKLVMNAKKQIINNYLYKILYSFIFSILGFVISIILWPSIWQNPIGEIVSSFKFFQTQWVGGPVLYFGSLYKAGITIPWHYPLGILSVTTPLLTILFSLVGIYIIIKGVGYKIFAENSETALASSEKRKVISPTNIFQKIFCTQAQIRAMKSESFENNIYLLLLLWFFIPLSKYFFTKIPVYDDTRQFMEILFPLSIFAAMGLIRIINLFRSIRLIRSIRSILLISFALLTCYFLYPFFRLHPYEMVYFNSIVGGTKNVYEKSLFDVDFWGVSLKEGVNWINNNAKPNQTVYSTFDVAHIVSAYLRPDLKLDYNNYQGADYLVILNRKTFFYPHVMEFLKNKKSIFTVKKAQTPLSWVY